MLSHKQKQKQKQNQNNSCNYFVLSVLLSFPHSFSVLVWILYFLPFSYMFLVGWNTFILSWFLEYMEQKINICFHFSILLLLPYRYDDCLRSLILLDSPCTLEKYTFTKTLQFVLWLFCLFQTILYQRIFYCWLLPIK